MRKERERKASSMLGGGMWCMFLPKFVEAVGRGWYGMKLIFLA
jgi:hypothetical protein